MGGGHGPKWPNGKYASVWFPQGGLFLRHDDHGVSECLESILFGIGYRTSRSLNSQNLSIERAQGPAPPGPTAWSCTWLIRAPEPNPILDLGGGAIGRHLLPTIGVTRGSGLGGGPKIFTDCRRFHTFHSPNLTTDLVGGGNYVLTPSAPVRPWPVA